MVNRSSVLFLLGLGAAKICTVKDDMKYSYAECDPRTQTTTAHFYFEKECGEGSDPVPQYMPNVQCDHLCPDDGMYSHIEMFPERKQVCTSCQGNTISVNGGFLLDAKMDDQDHMQTKILKHFEMYC